MVDSDQDAWVADTLGVNPQSYAAAAMPASAAASSSGENAPAKQPDLSQQPPQYTKIEGEELFPDGDPQKISDDDIHQGKLGDCYLLSSIGDIARINAATIGKMIRDNKDGTYTVTLHQRKGGVGRFIAGLFGGHPEFEAVEVTVDGNFPTGTGNNQGSANQGAGQDVVSGKKEIWVQVLEKAYAKLHGGYAKVGSGDWPKEAMEALTGQEATHKKVAGVTLADLWTAFKGGKPIVMNTPKKDSLPFNLVGPHAYMVEDITFPAGKATIVLRNPWGNNPGSQNAILSIPFEALSQGISSVDIGGALPHAPPAASPAPSTP
jgi:hypothetical protein